MNRVWTEKEIRFLKEHYLTMSRKELASALDRTESSVQNKMHKTGMVKSEKYNYNKRFFQKIDSEEKAYWLGFFFADGYTQKSLERRYCEAAIMLGVKDKSHLKKLNNSLNGNIEVTTRLKGTGFGDGKLHEMATIRLYSIDLVDDLISWGCVPNKVKHMTFPAISKEYYWPFIRGFFDGDGCIILNKQRRTPSCDFASTSYDFLQVIRKFLFEEKICSYYTQEKSGVWRLYIRGMENCVEFLDKLYGDSTIYLDRKYYRYIRYIEENNIREWIKNNTGHHKMHI